MEPIQVDFTKKGKSGVKDAYIAPEKSWLRILINIGVMLVVAVVAYYFLLPPMNFKSLDFYMYFAIVFASYIVSAVITSKAFARPEYIPYVKRQAIAPIVLIAILAVVLGIGYISSAALFRAKSYSQLLTVEESDFSDSFSAIESIEDFNKLPLIDADAAERLADKTLGDLALVGLESQFEVSNAYSTQINYKNAPYRVFPLQYGDIFKWLKNRADGLPGYIIVNMNTQESELVQIPEGISISTSEHFSRYLGRVLRFAYPTYIFGTPSFEIDDEGTPYWVCEHIDKTVGLVGGDDVVGVVLVNAVTGEHNYYNIEEIRAGVSADGTALSWIDQVYDTDLLLQQYNYYGRYAGGFINAYIGQTGVKMTTAGSSFFAIEDDVYLYTGVTSVTSDESILGFVVINQRTKDAYFYNVSGATERAAQESAKGIVSDKGWEATFPILINLDGEATYLMSLKDANDVIKSYAMVNVNQFSDAVRSPDDDNPDLKACLQAYINKLAARGVVIDIDMTGNVAADDATPSTDDDTPTADSETVSGTISDIRTAVIDGTTYYYIELDGSGTYYYVSAALGSEVVLFSVGDAVTLSVSTTASGEILPASDPVFAESVTGQ